MNNTEILSEQATIRSMVRGASHQPATVNLDPELNDALDAYSQRLKVLSEQATSNNDEATCGDIDLVFESLAAPATSRTFSAFEISNALLDVIDEGHLSHGHRWHWKFDYEGDEDRSNMERLDFRDLVLARLQKGGGK